MKLAFVYAGQGSQFAGMGKDLYEQYPTARAVFDQFPADFDLRTTCFADPQRLAEPDPVHPALYAGGGHGHHRYPAENGITPAMTAGRAWANTVPSTVPVCWTGKPQPS